MRQPLGDVARPSSIAPDEDGPEQRGPRQDRNGPILLSLPGGRDRGGDHDVHELCGLLSGEERPDCLRLVHDRTIQAPDRPGWSVYCSEIGPHQQRELTVSVVIPAMNEARNLPSVLLQIPKDGTDVVIVDGSSSDNTVEVVRELTPQATIVEQTARGKGHALAAGFAAARGDIIVMIDADGSMSPREIPAFVDALLQGADLAKGSRNLNEGGSADLTFLRNMGNRFLGTIFNGIHGTQHTDLCYGYMAFWRAHLVELMPDCAGFEVETWLNVRAAQAGLQVREVPSHEGRRVYGDSNLHPVRDGLRVLNTLLRDGLFAKRTSRREAEHAPTAALASHLYGRQIR